MPAICSPCADSASLAAGPSLSLQVRPLRKQLTGLKAWITGQRKDQSPGTRMAVPTVQVRGARLCAGGEAGPRGWKQHIPGAPSRCFCLSALCFSSAAFCLLDPARA